MTGTIFTRGRDGEHVLRSRCRWSFGEVLAPGCCAVRDRTCTKTRLSSYAGRMVTSIG